MLFRSTYGNGSIFEDYVYDDAVLDAIWKTWSQKELTPGNFWYGISEHTDSYGRKYYTYTITSFIAKPDGSNNIVIPRMIKNVYYKGKTVDTVLKEIGKDSFRNRYLEHVKIKGYGSPSYVRIGDRAFSNNLNLYSFYARTNETDASFIRIGGGAFSNDIRFSRIDISSSGTTRN